MRRSTATRLAFILSVSSTYRHQPWRSRPLPYSIFLTYEFVHGGRPFPCPYLQHHVLRTIISNQLKCNLVSLRFRLKTFESVCFSVTGSTSTVIVLLIYRPESVAPNELFCKELISYLVVLVLYKCQVIVAGDLNIHMERSTSANAVKLQNIIDSFDCAQHMLLTPTQRWRYTRFSFN